MVRSTSFTELAVWKALKRLRILGTLVPTARNGAVNPGRNRPRATAQELNKVRICNEIDYIIRRWKCRGKQSVGVEHWDLILRECRDINHDNWDHRVRKRLYMYEHRSHLAYVHALETLLRDRIEAMVARRYELLAIQMPNAPVLRPARVLKVDVTVRVIILREDTHDEAQGPIVSITLYEFLYPLI